MNDLCAPYTDPNFTFESATWQQKMCHPITETLAGLVTKVVVPCGLDFISLANPLRNQFVGLIPNYALRFFSNFFCLQQDLSYGYEIPIEVGRLTVAYGASKLDTKTFWGRKGLYAHSFLQALFGLGLQAYHSYRNEVLWRRKCLSLKPDSSQEIPSAPSKKEKKPDLVQMPDISVTGDDERISSANAGEIDQAIDVDSTNPGITSEKENVGLIDDSRESKT